MSKKAFTAETAAQVVEGSALYRRRNSKPAAILSWLKKGNSVNSADHSGTSLLHWFACEGNVEAAALLLDHGAQLECRNFAGATPLLLALNSDQANVAQLLIDRGADCCARMNDGRTALHCVFKWNIELVRHLLDRGADPTLPDDSGKSAIDRFATSEDGTLDAETQAILALMSDRAGVEAPIPIKPEPPPHTCRFTTDEPWQATCLKIWQHLVPTHGQADSVQGELLRAVERLRSEALRNGNMNWSADHRKLHRYLGTTLRSFDIFTADEHSTLTADLATIGAVKYPPTESDPYDRICRLIAQLDDRFPDPITRELDPELNI